MNNDNIITKEGKWLRTESQAADGQWIASFRLDKGKPTDRAKLLAEHALRLKTYEETGSIKIPSSIDE